MCTVSNLEWNVIVVSELCIHSGMGWECTSAPLTVRVPWGRVLCSVYMFIMPPNKVLVQ